MLSARKGKAPKRSESNPNLAEEAVAGPSAFTIDGAEEDEILRASRSLTREEVLRRRSRRSKQLALCYKRQYWALMEEVRVKHRDYYWEYGVSPYEGGDKEEEGEDLEQDKGEEDGRKRKRVAEENGEEMEATRVGRRVQLGFDEGEGGVGNIGHRKRCTFPGCKTKAMALTHYCHPHILSDKRQTLYKPCHSVTRSCGHSGSITCGKPILVATVPSLCHIHLQKHHRSISQSLKRAGLNAPGRPTPKLSYLLAEYILQIQDFRKEDWNSTIDTMDQKDEI